jgi:hypothetical protein
MDYAAVLEALSKMENGAELIDAIKGEVNRKGQENKSLRDRLKVFGEHTPDEIKTTKELLESIISSLEELGIDASKDIAAQLAAVKNERGQSGDLTKKVTDLTKLVSSLQKERDTERQEKDRLALDNKRKTIESNVSSLFQQRVLNPMVSMRYHIAQGDFDLDDTGAVVYKDSDGVSHPIAKGGFDSFLKVNPDAVKNAQSGGSGKKPDGGAGAGAGGAKLTVEAIKSMTPRQIADRYDEVQVVMKEASAAAA